MDVSKTVTIVDQILLYFGLAKSDLIILIVVMLVAGYAIFASYRYKCGNTLSCERLNKALIAIEKIGQDIDQVKTQHSENTGKLESHIIDGKSVTEALSELKSDMSLLRGILMGINPGSQNRRIIHE